MADRRRANGPAGGTTPPVFTSTLKLSAKPTTAPSRERPPNELRKIFLKTGVTPPASGSAYLELQAPAPPLSSTAFLPPSSSLKLTCTVHGPRPLPRSAPFSPHLVLSTHVKFAPFATRHRRGYVRDATERDLAAHLETALRGVVIGDRWPKSGADVVITVLEGEEDRWWGDEVTTGSVGGSSGVTCGLMNVLAGCITVASAALVDAGIDCVDLVAGGVAAILREPGRAKGLQEQMAANPRQLLLDPDPCEHRDIAAACVVGYLPARDEVTELWLTGDAGYTSEHLVDAAIQASSAASTVLAEAVKEAAVSRFGEVEGSEIKKADIKMMG